ncbi:MAG: DUF6390 family protein [Candidatus Micrarchaeota archaeon]|nr:DUF6390 family protein [Candidatus Micrarchaeota archaeon]
MLGIELAARFALPPNYLSYCGTKSFNSAFLSFLQTGSQNRLKRELSRFRAHYSYLELIAKANKKDPFDLEVCEAFWIGNRLLDNVGKSQLQKLILGKFCRPGLLSKSEAKKLALSLPDGACPHHSFHALYIHTIKGAIKPTVKNADLCRISWGKVKQKKSGFLFVDSQRLLQKNGKFFLAPFERKVRQSCGKFFPPSCIKKGDIVASHWDFAVMKISLRQKEALEFYTTKTIEAVNSV